MDRQRITVAGAGILGLWQALTLARDGHRVRLIDRSAKPFQLAASIHAGAMLSPDCEGEAAPALVSEQGRRGLELWRATYAGVIPNGSLVVAATRDQPDLTRFEKRTQGWQKLHAEDIAALEPDLSDRFPAALFFADEAHVITPDTLTSLLSDVYAAGVDVKWGQLLSPIHDSDIVIDCRGLGARDDLPTLRGVRGERLLVRARDVTLSRPVRLLHPRHPLYAVPWSDGLYLIGATMIESEDDGPVSVRSALELLGAAYALHPAFAEAGIMEMAAGVRPAFPDNVPRVIVRDNGRRLFVNGAYRHGFLLAPVLAEAAAAFIRDGAGHPLLARE